MKNCDHVWKPIHTAPIGRKLILLKGHSKALSFAGNVCVSGWIDSNGEIVHFYHYKLIITEWIPLP